MTATSPKDGALQRTISAIPCDDTAATGAAALPSRFPFLICIAAANFFRIGCQLVLTAWSAVQLTGRPESVGHVLLISSATNLALSPLLGALIDRCPRKKPFVLSGHCGIAICGAAPHALALALPQVSPFPALIVTALLSSISGITVACSMDYFVRHAIASDQRTRKLALLNTVCQLALIVGTACGGYLVSRLSWLDAFLLIGSCGMALATISLCLLPSLRYERRAGGHSPYAGPALYLKHKRLFAIASCSSLAFAVGQITNTLLPAFVNVDLKLSGQSYSLIEGAWSIGALCASAALAKVAKDRIGPLYRELCVVLFITGLLSLVPRLSALTALVLVHLALGVGFAIVRVRTEARFLTECPTHLLARFRANSVFLSSAVSALVFITPSISPGVGVPALYQLLSAAIAVSAVALIVFARPWQAEPSLHGPNRWHR